MGKIILTNYLGDTKIKLPNELIFLFKQSKARRIKCGLNYDNDTKVLRLTMTDLDWYDISTISYLSNHGGFVDRRKNTLVVTGEMQCYIRSNDRFSGTAVNALSFCVQKGKGYTICEKIELDYTVYQNTTGQIVITGAVCLGNLPINRSENKVRNSKDSLFRELNKVVPSISSYRFHNAVNDIGEIYYFKEVDGNNIIYVTKDKYAYAIANGISEEALSLHRTMGIGKFFKDHFPDVSEATVNAYIEFNKMLTCFDPNLFSIVSGDDIIKYYDKDSYFRMTGELGNSCMRDSSKSHVIKFYANNSNFRLLIMKAGQTDTIMARALLVTTTDGTVFMDRVYTVDTKIINLFHRYAKENGIKNIYQHRKPYGTGNLLSQGPGNWSKDYDDNYKVDLDWLPAAIDKINDSSKYQVATMQQASISSNYNVPYIDNFQYINAFTRQASVNALNFFTACELSGELIDSKTVCYYDGKVYDKRFVDEHFPNAPTLKIDTVTLDFSDTLQAGDDDIDENDEDFNWDDDDLDNDDLDSEEEVEENPYTINSEGHSGVDSIPFPLTTYQYMNGNLSPEAIARIIDATSPELRVILDQINDIATDSQQQEQHLF